MTIIQNRQVIQKFTAPLNDDGPQQQSSKAKKKKDVPADKAWDRSHQNRYSTWFKNGVRSSDLNKKCTYDTPWKYSMVPVLSRFEQSISPNTHMQSHKENCRQKKKQVWLCNFSNFFQGRKSGAWKKRYPGKNTDITNNATDWAIVSQNPGSI